MRGSSVGNLGLVGALTMGVSVVGCFPEDRASAVVDPARRDGGSSSGGGEFDGGAGGGVAGPPADARRTDEAPAVTARVGEGAWHLWVAGRWGLEAVHDPWSGASASPAEALALGPIADVAWDGAAQALWVLLEAGGIAILDGSLTWSTAVVLGGAPVALAVTDQRVFVADRDLGLFAFDRGPAGGVGALHASSSLRASRLVATPVGLFAAAVDRPLGPTVVHLDDALTELHAWRPAAGTAPVGLGYGPDGAVYVVDGGPCVTQFDNPEHRQGLATPDRTFCRPGRAYHAVLPTDDSDGYVAHEGGGIDVFREVSTVEDHVAPAHVLAVATPGPAPPAPRFLAHGWSP